VPSPVAACIAPNISPWITIAVHHPFTLSFPAQYFGYQPYQRRHQEKAEVDLLDDRKPDADGGGMRLEELETLAPGFLYAGRRSSRERLRPHRFYDDHLRDAGG
jgi:hypothetical protein